MRQRVRRAVVARVVASTASSGRSRSGPGFACSCQTRIASAAARSRTSTACTGVAEELLDEQRRVLIRRDEVGDRAEHGTLAEALALLEQTRRGRREADAVALELLERVDATLQRGERFVGAEQLGARERLALAGLAIGRARGLHLARRGGGRRLRLVHLDLELVVLAPRRWRACPRAAPAPRASAVGALAHLIELAHGALALVLDASHAILQLAQLALGALHGVARFGDGATHLVLRLLMPRELRFRGRGAAPAPARALRAARARSSAICTPLCSPAVASASARWRRAVALRCRSSATAISPRMRCTCSRCALTRRESSFRCASAAARAPCA